MNSINQEEQKLKEARKIVIEKNKQRIEQVTKQKMKKQKLYNKFNRGISNNNVLRTEKVPLQRQNTSIFNNNKLKFCDEIVSLNKSNNVKIDIIKEWFRLDIITINQKHILIDDIQSGTNTFYKVRNF